MGATVARVLAAILFAASATPAAYARHHGKASPPRHAHHHQAPGPVSAVGTGTAAAPVNAGEISENAAHVVGANRDHGRAVPRPESAAAMGKGHTVHLPAQHDINVDLIFVPPPGRNGKRAVITPTNNKKAVAAVPSAPIGYRRQRLDPAAGRAGKNAIGAVSSPAGGGRARLNASTIGAAAKTNAVGAHLVPQASVPPGGVATTGTRVSPMNAGHPAPGPAAVAALSTHGGGINGTGLGRAGITPGTIGGPAKTIAGISGTGMRLKR